MQSQNFFRILFFATQTVFFSLKNVDCTKKHRKKPNFYLKIHTIYMLVSMNVDNLLLHNTIFFIQKNKSKIEIEIFARIFVNKVNIGSSL